MKIGKRQIDHIVYCVPNLKEAIDDIEAKLGVRPVYGGQHLNQGTHNAILDLGEACYLEVLAIDHSNKFITNNRWMGIDLISKPIVTRWALKSDDLLADQAHLKSYDESLSRSTQGSRTTATGKKLSWQMMLPTASPLVQIIPFMVDWTDSEVHPCNGLSAGCRLHNIEFKAPDHPQMSACLFDLLGESYEISRADSTEIVVTLEGPSGVIAI